MSLSDEYLVYDNDNNLRIGSVTKTKNGIVVKSSHSPVIKEFLPKWEDVEFLNDSGTMTNPVYIFFKAPAFMKSKKRKEIKTIEKKYPKCAILVNDKNISVIGENIELCLKVCMFHGFSEIIVPIDVSDVLDVYQRKIFKKISIFDENSVNYNIRIYNNGV
jgi:hypothetical protein